jgi:glycosyltransferase involved in cell wall biosynthesis
VDISAVPSGPKRKVVFLARVLLRYRAPFLECLRVRLAKVGIDFVVIHGDANEREKIRQDEAAISTAILVPNKEIRFWGRTLYWQPVVDLLDGADLVITEQAAKLGINYYLFFLQFLGRTRVALWGHGRNLQTQQNWFSEYIKRFFSRRAHWWFAYNELSKGVVTSLGYPAERVTSFENTFDTAPLIAEVEGMDDRAREAVRAKYGIKGMHVCIFCGALYREKRLEFLVAAAGRLRQLDDQFELVVAGSGEDYAFVEAQASCNPWLHCVGARFGREKAELFAISRLQLMPGLVGLAIIDSFAAAVPLVTTRVPIHSPEISYLKNGENGLITADDMDEYVGAVRSLLNDSERYARLQAGARRAREHYTMANMVERMYQGILEALAK